MYYLKHDGSGRPIGTISYIVIICLIITAEKLWC